MGVLYPLLQKGVFKNQKVLPLLRSSTFYLLICCQIFFLRLILPPNCGMLLEKSGSVRRKEKVMMRSEKEKMLAGEYYHPKDEELVKERAFAKQLIFQFNHLNPRKTDKKQEILKQLIVAKGSFQIEAPFYCDYGYNIEVGENFYANYGCVILDVNPVKIGDNVLLAPNVQIYTATHPIDPAERLTGKEYGKPITIGNHVWIGGGAILCPGVTIGDNSIIGAGSVVTKDIPPNVIAAGNPCRVIKAIEG
jgi:maltose O-acetyltransferase